MKMVCHRSWLFSSEWFFGVDNARMLGEKETITGTA